MKNNGIDNLFALLTHTHTYIHTTMCQQKSFFLHVPRAGANANDVPARATTVAMIAEKRNMVLYLYM